MSTFLIFLAGMLAVFALLHARVLLRGRQGRAPQANVGDPTYWAMLVAFAVTLAALAAETWQHIPAQTTTAMWLGRALVVGSAIWTIWCRKVLGRGYAPTAQNPDPGQTLVRRGPYRYVRHPIYAGNVLTIAGLFLAFDLTWAWLSLFVLIAALTWRVRDEEEFLRAKFGRAYG